VRGGEVYAEVTHDIYGMKPAIWKEAAAMVERMGVGDLVDRDRLMEALRYPTGIPVRISGKPTAVRRVATIRSVATRGPDDDAGIPRPDTFPARVD
jgi:hypothetical protein